MQGHGAGKQLDGCMAGRKAFVAVFYLTILHNDQICKIVLQAFNSKKKSILAKENI